MLGLVAGHDGARLAQGQSTHGLSVGIASLEMVDEGQAARQVDTVVIGVGRQGRIQCGQSPIRVANIHEHTGQFERRCGIRRRSHESSLQLGDPLARWRVL